MYFIMGYDNASKKLGRRKSLVIFQKNLLLTGDPMTSTKYQDPKIDHTSWIQWIEENLIQVKGFYRQIVTKLKVIAKYFISKAYEELRFFISNLTIVDFICLSAITTIMVFALLFLFSGVGVVFYQMFLWMKNGVWSEFPIEIVFSFLFENTWLAQWLSNPESWFGLQRVMEWLLQNIPLSAALIIPSILIFSGMACILTGAIICRFYQFKNSKSNQSSAEA